jgi:ABC-type branched-subunit amino acid transport system substrate-binding protein
LSRFPSFRSCWYLAGTLALAGCAGQAPSSPLSGSLLPSASGSSAPAPSVIGKTSGPVALLLPLTGPNAAIGQILENAAKLALNTQGPALDIRDTGGTPQGATAAAQAAIAAGDGLILGPLTSAEAHAVAPIAQAAQVNVLAFTNDSSVDAHGVWALGISPAQQVQRVVQAAADSGRTQLAALLPDSDFGHSLAAALQSETATLSEPAPAITFYEPDNFAGLSQAIQQMSDFADRGQSIEDQITKARALNTAAGRATALALEHQPIPPPAFNALFIGATSGDTLDEIANFLPYYYVNQPQVQFLGPTLWATIAPAMAQNGVLNGALYAAPDPADAAAFDAKYQTTYGTPPPSIADVAFDAAAIAGLAAANGGYTTAVLTDPSGFTGTDGVLRLNPDGSVQRGLAVFQVAPGAPVITSPAPSQLAAPNS